MVHVPVRVCCYLWPHPSDIAQSRNIARLHYQIHNCDEILAVSLFCECAGHCVNVPVFVLLTTRYQSLTVDDPLPPIVYTATLTLCYPPAFHKCRGLPVYNSIVVPLIICYPLQNWILNSAKKNCHLYKVICTVMNHLLFLSHTCIHIIYIYL